MKDPSDAVRFYRQIGVAHGEAFQLMLYSSKDGAVKRWFWNSRDGVTPFGTFVGDVELQHNMGRYQPSYSAVLPRSAEFVWVDHTRETWREMLHRRWHRFKDHEPTEFHDPARFLEQFPTAEAFEAVEAYRPGEPHQLTRDEFLERTSSWMSYSMRRIGKKQAGRNLDGRTWDQYPEAR